MNGQDSLAKCKFSFVCNTCVGQLWMVINMHVTIFYYHMDECTEPGNFPDWTKILTSAGDMVQNVFNNDEWGLSIEIIPGINSNQCCQRRGLPAQLGYFEILCRELKNCWAGGLKLGYFSFVCPRQLFFLQICQFPVNSESFWASSMSKNILFINFRD